MLDVTLGIFAGLLLPTGWAKLRRPNETVKALQSVGWPHHRHLVFFLGAAEMAVGASVLVWGSADAVLALGALYVGFLLWLAVAFRSGGVVASCGCAGTADTPPTATHVVLNATAISTVFLDWRSSQPGFHLGNADVLAWVLVVVVITLGSWLALIAITDGARLSGLVKS